MLKPFDERGAAARILSDVTDGGAYANAALREYFKRSPDAAAVNKAFVTELVYTALRNLLLIDYIIDAFSNTPARKMKPFIRAVLRTAVCQTRFMDKVPVSAAVNEAVRLTKARGYDNLAGFVNGVLRSAAREPERPTVPDGALKYSYPEWLYVALGGWLGADSAERFIERCHRPPCVTAFVNTLKTTPDGLLARLKAEGAEAGKGALFPEFIRLRHMADVTRLPSFRDGLFFIMDEGAYAAVRALDLRPGARVIDLCAAPGGKAFAAAVKMEGKGRVAAFDIYPHKIKLIDETAARLGLDNIDASIGDAAAVAPELINTADAVLLDAPCSGFGVLRRRPEIKYRRRPEDITALAAAQRAMLSAAAAYVKPGGVLVYCTCTVTREENMDNINWFIGREPFAITPLALDSIQNPGAECTAENGCLQLLPGPYNDGFFVAKLTKFTELTELPKFPELTGAL